MGANAQTTVPLFTSGQVLTAAQQNTSAGTGVPVFATTTTRDAAFGGSNKALAEGQLCYIEASDVVQYYSGSAWATVGPSTSGGLVPVVPTSAAVGSGSATFSSTTGFVTVTGASSVSLNGVFTATYNNYFINLNLLSVAGTPIPTFRVRAAGTDLTSSTYSYASLYIDATTLGFFFGSNSATSIQINQTNTTSGMYAINLNSPFLSARTGLTYSSAANGIASGGGAVLNTTSYDGFTITTPTSTLTGTISVYGYNQ